LGTTGALATGESSALLKLVSKQEALSQNIIQAYKKKDRGSSALAMIDALESGHQTLKSSIDDPEIDYLLVYLKTCLNDLKSVVKQPYSPQNAKLVNDLSASLNEGNRYIARALR
jgi:hypothetical protein